MLERFAAARSRLVAATFDVAAWVFGLWFSALGRNSLDTEALEREGLLFVIVLAALLHLTVARALYLYRGRFRLASFEEEVAIAQCLLLTTVILTAVTYSGLLGVEETVPIGGAAIAGLLMGAVRLLRRAWLERISRRSATRAERVLVFGMGDGGVQAIEAMLADTQGTYLPVAALDDDPTRAGLRIMGVPFAGTRVDVVSAARRFDAQMLVVAVPSADATLLSDLRDRAEDAGLVVKVLPSVSDLISGRVEVRDLRDVNLNDLLGRHPVETDVQQIGEYLRGRRVLVTGAGGSIGSELCLEIQKYGPGVLVLLDRDESALHAVQLQLRGHGLLNSDEVVLADIRDVPRMVKIFEHHRPDIVFHAAALKHLPLLERAPGEAVKTNIWGTLSVLDAATQAGVEYFINISTDKAADPTSVLGYSKRLAERLTAEVAVRTGRPYLSVRFGNVLGSRGSVLTGFSAQVAHGQPMTVTHPEVTRYFMTVREAVQLVIQASAIGRGGEVLVLDMGEPVRIADVAKRVAAAAGRPLDVVYTGLRPGEKLHEVLFGAGETDVRRVHPQVSHVAVPPLHAREVLKLDPTSEATTLIAQMQDLCDGETQPPESLLGVLYPDGWEERRRRPWDGPERRRGNRRERVFHVGWDSVLDAAHDRAG